MRMLHELLRTVISSSHSDHGVVVLRLEVVIVSYMYMSHTLILSNTIRDRIVIKTAIGYVTKHEEECE